jgi:glyoxylase-like metal-dependent hydrolase (beta-lactamase superfamily II)
VLLRDGTDVTLIDTGYPGDIDALEQSVREIGARPEDVRAVLLTHAHIDHIGGANHFHDRYGAAVHTGAVEVAHAHRDYLEQAGPRDVLANAWRPGALPWALRVVRAGATKDISIPAAQPFPNAGALDLPGAPVPVPMPGHTSGHTAYLLPAAGAVATGDGLVTGHAMLRGTGPQVLPPMFNHGDPLAGLAALEGLDAELVLPGHGDPLRRPLAAVVAEARARSSVSRRRPR